IPIRGNVGAQEVFTNQSAQGFRADVSSNVTLTNPAGALSEAGTSYADFLPSLNLTGDFGNGNLLRFAAGEQIARADLTAMRNSFALSTNNQIGGIFVGSAGNAALRPFKDTAVDLSYEKYFGTKAYVSAAAFYKYLNTYVTQYTDFAYDFTQQAQTLGIAIPAAGPVG